MVCKIKPFFVFALCFRLTTKITNKYNKRPQLPKKKDFEQKSFIFSGCSGRDRTYDQVINSYVLFGILSTFAGFGVHEVGGFPLNSGWSELDIWYAAESIAKNNKSKVRISSF